MHVKATLLISLVLAMSPQMSTIAASAGTKPQSGFGTSSREPIQIDADSLEVFDAEQRAVYSGNVIVKQGETTMKAAKIIVHYDRRGAAPLGGTQPADPVAVMNDNTGLKKVEAEGGVAIFSRDQVATGDRGVYDRTTDIVTLTGNVTLSRGKNVTRGQRLVYNVGTGIATMAAGSGGRVSSSFAPTQQQTPAKGKAP
jgi:lipopolysaccharide export system protein LptA